MKALRNLAQRLRQPRPRPNRTGGSETRPDKPRVEYSYSVYWVKQARQWDKARRAAVSEALAVVLGQSDFEANAYARRYRVPGLDEQAHAGASLAALKEVLSAFGTQD